MFQTNSPYPGYFPRISQRGRIIWVNPVIIMNQFWVSRSPIGLTWISHSDSFVRSYVSRGFPLVQTTLQQPIRSHRRRLPAMHERRHNILEKSKRKMNWNRGDSLTAPVVALFTEEICFGQQRSARTDCTVHQLRVFFTHPCRQGTGIWSTKRNPFCVLVERILQIDCFNEIG